MIFISDSEERKNELTDEEKEEQMKKDIENMSLEEIASKSARDGMSEKAISYLLSDNTMDSMKAFLVVLAKRELKRVVKIINSLGEMEDSLIDIVRDRRERNELSSTELAYLIRTLHSSLDRSMELIHSIVEDEKYYQFIIDNSQETTINNVPEYLTDSSSRERVRVAVNNLIETIDTGKVDEKAVDSLQDEGVITVNSEEE